MCEKTESLSGINEVRKAVMEAEKRLNLWEKHMK